MITILTSGFKDILRNIRSGNILNRIGSGRIVYFENPVENTAFRYIPGGPGALGKYYAKFYNQNEFEIDADSSSILRAVMQGKQISKARYDKYHLAENIYWDRDPGNSANEQYYKYLVNG